MNRIGKFGLMVISLLPLLLVACSSTKLISSWKADDVSDLIYSAQTRSVDPASPQSLATEFSEKIFEDMSLKGVIK
jgi:hypothetical protein